MSTRENIRLIARAPCPSTSTRTEMAPQKPNALFVIHFPNLSSSRYLSTLNQNIYALITTD